MTGTFDDWSKSVKLDHDGTTFQKTVSLPNATEKIYYKVSMSMSMRGQVYEEGGSLTNKDVTVCRRR